MSQYYDRRYEILVDGKPFISATDGPMFRCAFDVSINPSDTNSTADIRIYNLNDNSTGKVLKRQRTITLRAGYVETIDTIFTGTIINTFQEREGPSVITRLLCKAAQLPADRGTISASFGAGVTVMDLLNALAGAMPQVLLADDRQFEDVPPYPRGYTLNGDIRTCLDALAYAHKFSYIFFNGALIVDRGGYERYGSERIVSRYTGMEGVPEITGGEQGVGCDVSVRLDPKMRVNGKFKIRAEFATFNTGNMFFTEIPELKSLGTYNILSITHNGDTHGDTWSTRLSGIKPGKPTTSTVAGKLHWGRKVKQEFRDKVRTIAADIGIEPDWLMDIMAWETGESFSPSIYNRTGSGAVGLIQFMPSTARALGTSSVALARMDAVEQLDYVHAYFSDYKNRLHNLSDTYMAVFWPAGIGKADTYVLFDNTSPAWAGNSDLDVNPTDGTITKKKATAPVYRASIKGANYAA